MPSKKETAFFEAITALSELKKRDRTGWVDSGVSKAESVSDHSWRAGLMAYMLAPKGYDKEKMLKMGLIHDATEIFEKDYTPADGITKKEKEKLERKSVEKFFKLLPKAQQNEFRKIWNEFEHKTTKEGIFVKQIETLEMLFQALEYHNDNAAKKNIYEFMEYERNNRKTNWHPVLRPYYEEIEKRWSKDSKKKYNHADKKYYY